MLKALYKKALKNLKQRVRYYEKKGFILDIDIKQPKRITQGSINKLNRIRGEKLLKKGGYVDYRTGEYYEGKKGVHKYNENKKQIGYKTNWADIVVGATIEELGYTYNLIEELNTFDTIKFDHNADTRKDCVNILILYVQNFIASEGVDTFANVLYENKQEIEELKDVIFGDSYDDKIYKATQEFMTVLNPNITVSERLDISDQVDEDEVFNSYD